MTSHQWSRYLVETPLKSTVVASPGISQRTSKSLVTPQAWSILI